MKYKPDDWVVLGGGGSGWSAGAQGLIVQIKDIGPHLGPGMCSKSYDFYIYPNTNPSASQIVRVDGGGSSRNIERHATFSEILAAGGKAMDLNYVLTL